MTDLTVGACCNFHVTGVECMNEATPAALHIEDLFSIYTPKVDILSSIVNRKRSYVKTLDLQATDQTRDNAIGTITLAIRAFRTSPVTEKKAAASRLYQELSPYRGIGEHEYNKETAEIRGMLALLDEEENKACIATLGLTEEVEVLGEANTAFETAFKERLKEKNEVSELEDIDTETLVAEVNDLYAQIRERVNAYAIVQPTDEINSFIDNMNGLVKSLADVAGSSVNEKDPDSPNVPDEPTTPEITKFYPKENANPDKPLDFPRNKTAVLEGKGLKLVDSPEGKKAQLVLINYVDQRMPHEDSAILLNTDEKIEFTMMYDAAEGQYNFQIETYPNGTEEAVIIKYPETITLI